MLFHARRESQEMPPESRRTFQRELIKSPALLAAGNSEGRQPGAPVKRATGLQVLRGVPKGAVVHGIDRNAGVVSPAVEVPELRARARDDARFRLKGSRRVTGNAYGKANRRVNLTARHAIANSDVPDLIHGDAPHPARIRVGRKCALLKDRRSAVGAPDFVPAHAIHLATVLATATHADAVIDHQRFMCGRRREVAISEPVHQAVTERIELLPRSRLRNARPAAAKSTWNFQRFRRFVPKLRKKLGELAGGAVAPSRSDGSRPPNEEDS